MTVFVLASGKRVCSRVKKSVEINYVVLKRGRRPHGCLQI